MSFKADFEVAGKKYTVLHCNYSFHQDTDTTGRPSSGVRGGTILLEIESASDSTITEWAAHPFRCYDGKITFYRRDSEQKMKEVAFWDGYVVSYSENFISTGETPMSEHFVISAKKIKAGNAEHDNEWPE